MATNWPYFELTADGRLRDEDGGYLLDCPRFTSAAQAQKYLIDNDIRGTIV